jgi:hypothetical protein
VLTFRRIEEVRMKTVTTLFALALVAAPGWTQCHKLAEVNSGTPEGQLLQQAGQEEDAAKKMALQEQFIAQYPQHEAAAWVYEQLLTAYVKANDADKALAVADKLAAMPPECVENAQQTLKAAELKKDPDLVLKWSGKTADRCRRGRKLESARGLRPPSQHLHRVLAIRHGARNRRSQEAGGAAGGAAAAQRQERVLWQSHRHAVRRVSEIGRQR